MIRPYNPFFFPFLCCAAVANVAVNAVDEGKTDTLPANPLGQMVTVAVTSGTASALVGTVVMHTIIEGAYDTWLGEQTKFGDDIARR